MQQASAGDAPEHELAAATIITLFREGNRTLSELRAAMSDHRWLSRDALELARTSPTIEIRAHNRAARLQQTNGTPGWHGLGSGYHARANCFAKCTEIRFEFEALMDSDNKGRKLFENLNPVQRLKLIDRHVDQLRAASKTMAADGRLDMVEALDDIANDFEANASELAATMIGVDVLVRAAGLMEMVRVLTSGRDEAATVH